MRDLLLFAKHLFVAARNVWHGTDADTVIHYSIAEDRIGASWGIEGYIVGLDRNWSYNPACKMTRQDSAEARRNQSRHRSVDEMEDA